MELYWRENLQQNICWEKHTGTIPNMFSPKKQNITKTNKPNGLLLTAKNIDDWTDNYKKCMFDIEFVKDESGFICSFFWLLLFIFWIF